MSRHDNCEIQIIAALNKEGWVVKTEQLSLRFDVLRYIYIDLEIQSIHAADTAFVLEVKCFQKPDAQLDDFYRAMGQYVFYRNMLAIAHISSPLYLAIPYTIYQTLFGRPAIQATLKELGLKLIVVNLQTEIIEQWINY
jgi:hypothetical protein